MAALKGELKEEVAEGKEEEPAVPGTNDALCTNTGFQHPLPPPPPQLTSNRGYLLPAIFLVNPLWRLPACDSEIVIESFLHCSTVCLVIWHIERPLSLFRIW